MTEPKLVHHKKKKEANVWMIASIVLTVLFVVSVFTNGLTSFTGVSEKKAEQSLQNYIEENLQGANATVETIGTIKAYKMKVDINGQVVESLVTADGKTLYPQPIPLEVAEEPVDLQEPKTGIEKSDKPEVELFVMSHCPFGTQAEKGIIPAVQALGDSIDFKLKFVYYAMHPSAGEVEEQLSQYCIQKEQEDKFLDYLTCFLGEGDGEACLADVGVDVEKMEACFEDADKEFEIMDNLEDKSKWLNGRYPLFNTHKELNEQYGVRGSPTLVINGATSGAGRDPASYLAGICEAFNEAPEACNTELSTESYGAGFGYDVAAAASGGSCS